MSRAATQNVGSSGLMDCQLTELQQAEQQLHQHAVSTPSCRDRKAKRLSPPFSSRVQHVFTRRASYCGIRREAP